MPAIRADRLKEDRMERSKRIKWLDLASIGKSKVLVVGAGAIGNEVCKNLLLSGYQNITIVDMDQIERSNLNRCLFFSDLDAENKRSKAEVVAQKLKTLNDSVKVAYHTEKIQNLPEDFIPSFDLVFGCLDNVAARLHVNAFCYHHKVPYIDGATDGFIGKVQVVMAPNTPCLECTMNKTHMKVMEMRFSCTGKDVTFFQQKLPAEITTTSIIAAVAVREGLKISSNIESHFSKKIFYYNGAKNIQEVLEIEINPNCPHHV
ncbi:MAG: ThiF family adenylyltransferase [Thermoplasmata archaeon]|nr:MAG: ThiF family adenylyltransferase [Thermoplasmata archaeon]